MKRKHNKIKRKKYYIPVKVDKRRKPICLNGHDISICGRGKDRACKQCKKDNHPLKVGKPKQQFCSKGHDTFATGRDKANSQCVVCRQEVSRSEEKITYMKKYYQKHKKEIRVKIRPKIKAWRLLRYYNMTVEDYNKMLKKQKNRCAGCKKSSSEFKNFLSVDHDHRCCSGATSCGKCIRGLLCQPCNLILGNANDNIKTLKQLIGYLIKYE